MTFVRIPETLLHTALRLSGTAESSGIFVRNFVGKDTPDAKVYTNIWLPKGTTLQEANSKHVALADDVAAGLIWSPKGYGMRIRTTEVATVGPTINGKVFVEGEAYELCGVPRDILPEDMLKALASTEVPWPEAADGQVLSRRGSTWILRVSTPPPASIFFFGELLISVKPAQQRKPAAKSASAREQRPRPTKDGHDAAAAPRPARTVVPDAVQTALTGLPPAAANAIAAGPAERVEADMETKDNLDDEKPRSRSPRGARSREARDGCQPRAAAEQTNVQQEVNDMRAQMVKMMEQIAALTEQLARVASKLE
jgi:hypothetical protein